MGTPTLGTLVPPGPRTPEHLDLPDRPSGDTGVFSDSSVVGGVDLRGRVPLVPLV